LLENLEIRPLKIEATRSFVQQDVFPKRLRISIVLHGVTYRNKMLFLLITALKISNLNLFTLPNAEKCLDLVNLYFSMQIT